MYSLILDRCQLILLPPDVRLSLAEFPSDASCVTLPIFPLLPECNHLLTKLLLPMYMLLLRLGCLCPLLGEIRGETSYGLALVLQPIHLSSAMFGVYRLAKLLISTSSLLKRNECL